MDCVTFLRANSEQKMEIKGGPTLFSVIVNKLIRISSGKIYAWLKGSWVWLILVSTPWELLET